MYNTIKLHPKDWCFQPYIWQQDLNPMKIPREKVIKTLIYGIRSRRFTGAMKDLSTTTFFVPILDDASPIAFSIASDVHWHGEVQHSGIETTLRHIMKKCFIINGRNLVKRIKRSCHRCRYLEKRTVEMAMGPVSMCQLTIAPAFYFSQVDLSGPYQCYSPQHKRTTVKVWLIVFCCCSTRSRQWMTIQQQHSSKQPQGLPPTMDSPNVSCAMKVANSSRAARRCV